MTAVRGHSEKKKKLMWAGNADAGSFMAKFFNKMTSPLPSSVSLSLKEAQRERRIDREAQGQE